MVETKVFWTGSESRSKNDRHSMPARTLVLITAAPHTYLNEAVNELVRQADPVKPQADNRILVVCEAQMSAETELEQAFLADIAIVSRWCFEGQMNCDLKVSNIACNAVAEEALTLMAQRYDKIVAQAQLRHVAAYPRQVLQRPKCKK